MDERGIATLQICPRCERCFDDSASKCPYDGISLESPRTLPYRLMGRYRFLFVLGQGGMGTVIAARDEKLDRDIAVKLIRPEQFNNSDLKQRFEREAHAVARIQHPGVIALYDSGETDDGTAFLVMEMLEGSSLAQLIERYGRGTPAQVAALARQGSSAIAAAHRAGVIHRDIKPANIFLVADDAGFRVKVLDFGVAKTITFDKALTQTGVLVGTPAYMSPEQVRGDEVDARSDLYSFATVCYEALTGRKVVSGHDFGQLVMNVLSGPPIAISQLLPGMWSEVDLSFAAALAKDRTAREKDVERWGVSFAKVLESHHADPATAGWPATPNSRRHPDTIAGNESETAAFGQEEQLRATEIDRRAR
jgi:eukaryotic-like serine/threonine-protein kinase